MSILVAEFPQVPESEIVVVLEMFQGNLKETRKDLKFKIFREQMQEEIPMLSSVRCYEAFKECGYNSDKAKMELLEKPPIPPRGSDQYEFLS